MTDFAGIAARMAEVRHALHRNPELAGREFETAALIRRELARIGLVPRAPLLGTDTAVLIEGGRGTGRNVTLRADIDALAIQEESGREYASRVSGVMHACGHDGHTAVLLGAAEALAGLRGEFSGSVRCVWQPGEENASLGRDLVAAGVLDSPCADCVTALHGMPGLPVGVFGCRDGAIMASCAHFKVELRGRGGHSSRPHQAVDPVVAAAAVILESQTLVSRRIDPLRTAVLSICRVEAGTQANIIPDTALLEGTARSLDDRTAEALERGFRELVEAVARAHRCSAEIQYDRRYPVTVNAPEPTALARKVLRETFGDARYVELPEPSMGAEDFAYYLQRCPGVYVKLGVGEEAPPLHNSKFDFPDEAIEPGIRYFVGFALAALR